jgi:hypothetical protein
MNSDRFALDIGPMQLLPQRLILPWAGRAAAPVRRVIRCPVGRRNDGRLVATRTTRDDDGERSQRQNERDGAG